ncbi:SDR family NAD(P)-dependent oxidoreductase [Frigidibacter sp. MR17.24]|uniref:SDR family NAD(P)-dependent oxidoreductase n=1 Tax=Frigidibacter sp. MR17.24 TaxID=3127345 RepID=UPI003012B8A7
MSLRTIVLTGASGGLGRALAAELAAPGRRLLLCGRDPDRLAAAAAAARARGAEVDLLTLPLTAPAAVAAALVAYDRRHPIDLLIANAGVKTGQEHGCEPIGESERVIAVNLTANLHIVQAVVPGMRTRGRGRIALVSSLAALSPHADLLSYSATKAGLRAYGIALRRALRGSGVGVSVITPGFIDTPMTDRHLGPRPLTLPPETAARIIARGLARGRAQIAFPALLVALVRLEDLLPRPLGDWIDSFTRARTLPDADEEARR